MVGLIHGKRFYTTKTDEEVKDDSKGEDEEGKEAEWSGR